MKEVPLKSWMVARSCRLNMCCASRAEGIVQFRRIQNISLFFWRNAAAGSAPGSSVEKTKKRFLSKGKAPPGSHRRAVNAANFIRLTKYSGEIHSEAREPAGMIWHFKRVSGHSADFRCAVQGKRREVLLLFICYRKSFMEIGIASSAQFYDAHPWLQVQPQLSNGVREQESLPDMLDDFKAKCKTLEKKIADFKKELTRHENITSDLRAAQAALESYLLAHKDQQGDIKTDDIKVFLPETSPLRTGKTETVSMRELMNYYQETQPALQLPTIPESISVSDIGRYQKTLDEAIVTASSFFNEVKQADLSEIVSRRQSLLDLMAHLIKTYGDLLLEGLRR